MHRSKIEWCDDTWNPITGCSYDCRYCYARKKSGRFTGDIRKNLTSMQYEKEGDLFVLNSPFLGKNGGNLNYPFGFWPTYHRYRLNYPADRKNGCNILMGEMGEMFGEWIPDSWLKEIFEACKGQEHHQYLFLTRNPARYKELYQKGILPMDKNFWYGSTVIANGDPIPTIPASVNTFICIEPIREEIRMSDNNIPIVNWIIIGAESGNGKEKISPERSWIQVMEDYAERVQIPVFMKNSLFSVMGTEIKQDFPSELLKKLVSPKVRKRQESDCCKCKVHMQKNKMVALSARFNRGERPKQFSFMCHECFSNFCNEMDIEDD